MYVDYEKLKLVGPEVIVKNLDVSRNTVLNWANEGKIPCWKIGKVYRFSLEEVMESARNFSRGQAA